MPTCHWGSLSKNGLSQLITMSGAAGNAMKSRLKPIQSGSAVSSNAQNAILKRNPFRHILSAAQHGIRQGSGGQRTPAINVVMNILRTTSCQSLRNPAAALLPAAAHHPLVVADPAAVVPAAAGDLALHHFPQLIDQSQRFPGAQLIRQDLLQSCLCLRSGNFWFRRDPCRSK